MAADLLGGEAVQPLLAGHHQDAEESRQRQHGPLELPEAVLLHHSGAAAGEENDGSVTADGSGGRSAALPLGRRAKTELLPLVLVSVGPGAVDSLHVSRRSAGRPRPLKRKRLSLLLSVS